MVVFLCMCLSHIQTDFSIVWGKQSGYKKGTLKKVISLAWSSVPGDLSFVLWFYFVVLLLFNSKERKIGWILTEKDSSENRY